MRRPKTEAAAEKKRLGTLIGLAGRQWRRAIDLRLKDFDLTEATWSPLVQLARSSGPLRQTDIAAALSLDKSSVVRVLNNLETAGLIARNANEDDRRAKAIVITAAGRALVKKLERTSEDLERELLAGLPQTEVAAARRTLDHVCRMLLQMSDKGSQS
ncbi:MAG: MarR family winged helix-turn-helix transcriptional regulator [Hyphomicrobiaceae bacterium]